MKPPQLSKELIEASPFLKFVGSRVCKKRLYHVIVLKILISIFNSV